MGLVETIFGGRGGGVQRDSFLFFGWFGSSNNSSTFSSSSSTLSTIFLHLLVFHLVWTLTSSNNYSVMGGGGSTECMKRKYYEITVSYFGGLSINRTVKCDMYFQWTVADYCCYDKYDRFERNPFCCYSETYKLVLAVGFICLVLLACSFSIFFCWLYNLPHHLLYVLTCGKFHLNDWMLRNKNGPYENPSFYSGEPFWARGAEMLPYPLRPMPPKIFYPAPPPKLKYRWDMTNGETPLFVIASRQFTRNPFSARPQDRSTSNNNSTGSQSHPTGNGNSSSGGGGGFFSSSESRRNSLSSNHNNTGRLNTNSSALSVSSNETGSSTHNNNYQLAHQQQRQTSSAQNGGGTRRGSSALYPYRGGSQPPKDPPPFKVNIDETEAAQELFEALKMLDERGDKTVQEWNDMLSNDDSGATQSPDYDDDDDNNSRGVSGSSSHHHQMSSLSDSGGGAGGSNSNGIYTLSNRVAGSTPSIPLGGVRPNTTGGAGSLLDQYGNYVSLTSHALVKPNTDALNQQLSTLGLPIYNMPGVHTAGVLNTVQNYHVVSSNLGNPMETILEDESFDEELIPEEGGGKHQDQKSEKFEDDDDDEDEEGVKFSLSTLSSSSPVSLDSKVNLRRSQQTPPVVRGGRSRPPLKRRATTITGTCATVESPVKSQTCSRVSTALQNHVVGPTPTTRADVPFMPTLPGSLSPEGHALDATFVDTVVRRNSVI